MCKTLPLLLTGISLFLAIPAPAAEKADLGKHPGGAAVRVVEIKGKLYHVKGVAESNPPKPFEYWKLLAAGKTYYLHLPSKELLGLAEKLTSRVTVVTGILVPSSATICVTGLRADEYARVEIKGKLSRGIRYLAEEKRDKRYPMPYLISGV
jgi:hypothetical protein